MSGTFAERCGAHDAAREEALQRVLRRMLDERIDLVRISWCDLHGQLHGKALTARAVERALRDGVGMVSTLMLKDTSGRTAYPVFEPGGTAALPGFGQGNNLVLLPDPDSFTPLPWSPGSAALRAQPWFEDGTPVALDTRRVLQQALARLAQRGYGMVCGLEVEFHIYRLREGPQPMLDPEQAAWPGPAPLVDMIHPGYSLLDEAWFDLAEAPLRIVRDTALGLGLPLASLEIEMGPSQVEAVFDATDALRAADQMVQFRAAVKAALRRAGYHASFMCRPPFPNVMSSGWHLHQSLVRLDDGRNAFMREAPAAGSDALDAGHVLSPAGQHWLAGLLQHARGGAVFGTPTINGYARFRPNALAPLQVLWGHDNRGAMLRVVGGSGDAATRIENRIGEPAANPYLYLAAQVHAGLDGLARELAPPRGTDAPYRTEAAGAEKLPATLPDALAALKQDADLVQAFGAPFIDHLVRLKNSELLRAAQATEAAEFERREYFTRF